MFKNLFCALVRPHLEYCSVLSTPRFLKDKLSLEKVLRRATKLIPGMKALEYSHRLKQIKIPSMKYRFERGEMIEVYKILHSCYNIDKTLLFPIVNNSVTRGHNLKISTVCNSNVRKTFFTMRVVNAWNSLPSDLVNSPSIDTFKNNLDIVWFEKMFIHY
jgi:hypothetical protein